MVLKRMIRPKPIFGYRMESNSRPGLFYIAKLYDSGEIQCCQEKEQNSGCEASEMGKVCSHQKKMLGIIQHIVTESYKLYGQNSGKTVNKN